MYVIAGEWGLWFEMDFYFAGCFAQQVDARMQDDVYMVGVVDDGVYVVDGKCVEQVVVVADFYVSVGNCDVKLLDVWG